MGLFGKLFGENPGTKDALACVRILSLMLFADGGSGHSDRKDDTMDVCLEHLKVDPKNSGLSKKDLLQAGMEAGEVIVNGQEEEFIAKQLTDISDYAKRCLLLLTTIKVAEADGLSERELQMFFKIAFGLQIKKDNIDEIVSKFSAESKERMLKYVPY